MADVFICYARRDSKPFVKRLHRALENLGKVVWVDWEIPTGSKWEDDLREGIADSDAFIYVISPDAIESKYCRTELEYAGELNKRILPLRHRAVPGAGVPELVSTHNWLPAEGAFEDSFDECMVALVKAINTDLPWVRAHTHWGKRAVEWDQRGRDRSFLLRGSELRAMEVWLSRQPGKEPAPTQLQTDYILASRKASSRRQRLTLVAVASALVVSATLAVLAVVQRNAAVRQQKTAVSRELAGAAMANLQTDPELGLLLATQAAETRDTSEAERALRKALAESHLRRTWRVPSGYLTAVAFSSAGRQSVIVLDGPTARVWDLASGKQTIVRPGAHRRGVGRSVQPRWPLRDYGIRRWQHPSVGPGER